MSLLQDPEVAAVLHANIGLMSDRSSKSASAFASEYIAFQSNWSAYVPEGGVVTKIIIIYDLVPTFDIGYLVRLKKAYTNMFFEKREDTGLALQYQQYTYFIPILASAARRNRLSN